MFSDKKYQISALVAGLGLLVGGCSKPEFNPEREVIATKAVSMPHWSTSVRLYEVTNGKWAMAVIGGSGAAISEASAPKPNGKVEFGEIFKDPSWSVSYNMVKMENDQWYVVAIGGSSVAVTEARGQYSANIKATASEAKSIDGWSVSSRIVKMQDGYNYVAIIGGSDIDIRPLETSE